MNLQQFAVTIDFIEPILGTVPKDKEIASTYLLEKAIALKAEGKIEIAPRAAADVGVTVLTDDLIREEIEGVIEDLEQRGYTGFLEEGEPWDQGGHLHGRPYVLDYYLKANIKDAANTLHGAAQMGIAAVASKITKYVFIRPRAIFFDRTDGDGRKPLEWSINERPLRAQTAQGPRVALVRSDQLANVSLSYTIVLLDNDGTRATKSSPGSPAITEATLREILSYGEFSGCGQWRNASWGTYTVRSFERIGR